jgi:hypothetical protein
MGSIRAAYGASGFQMAGTPSMVLADQEMITQRNVMNIKYNGLLQAKNLRAQADMYRNEASSNRTAGIFGAVGSGLSGAADIFKRTR